MSYKYRSTAGKKKTQVPPFRARRRRNLKTRRDLHSRSPPPNLAGGRPFFSRSIQWVARGASAVSILPFPFFFSFLAKSQVAKSTRGKRAAQHSEILDRIATKSRISHREEDENEEDVVHAKKANQNLFGGPFRRRAVPAVSSERVVSSSGTVEIDRSWGVARALAGEEEGSRRG